jgi:uncharacterized protein
MVQFIQFLLYLFVFYIFLVAFFVLAQRNLMYLPPPVTEKMKDDLTQNGFLPVPLVTLDSINLTGFLRPPQGPKPILLVFHGNAGHAAWQLYKFPTLMNQGYGFFLAQYRGYAGQMGKRSEQGFYADGLAHLTYLQKNYPNHPIILYGESLGSGVAVYLAAQRPENLAGLILETPYNSILAVAQHHYPFIPFQSYLLKDQYLSDQKIDSVSVPILFLVAGRDFVVPKKFAEKLYEAAPSPKFWSYYPEASHVGVYSHGAEKDVLRFLTETIP